MSKRQFVTKSGDTFEWDETPESVEAIKKLHESSKMVAEHDKLGTKPRKG